MNTVFYNSRVTDVALVNPTDSISIIRPDELLPEVCISTFSKQIIDKFASLDHVKVIARLKTANGEIPIYKINYGGKDFAFYLSLVGAPACVSCLEEVIALGTRKLIFFGCCGVLNDDAVGRHLILPTAAVRDEGTSYHYAAPAEEIAPDPAMTHLLETCFTRCGYSYVSGKIWTTDAIYRETLTAIRERREAGCIAVDMEYSALLAAARYRNVDFAQFFYGADSLDHEEWNPRDLTDYGLTNAEKYMALALECGLELYHGDRPASS